MATRERIFVDDTGRPLDERLQSALRTAAPRLTRDFPALSDDCDRTRVLETAAGLVARREARYGAVDSVLKYTLKVVRRIAARVARRTPVMVSASAERLEALTAARGAAASPEVQVAIRRAVGRLDPEARQAVRMHAAGLTRKEMAVRSGVPVRRVEAALRRARRTLRRLGITNVG